MSGKSVAIILRAVLSQVRLRNLSSQGRVEKTFVIAEDKVDDWRDRDEGGLMLLVDIELVAGKYVEDTPQYTGKY
jgi:hypothetical protein